MRSSGTTRLCALALLALAGQELIGRYRTRRQIASALAELGDSPPPGPSAPRAVCNTPNCAGHRIRA